MESSMVQSREKVLMTDPYSYGLEANWGNSGWDVINIPSERTISTVHDAEVVHNIPRSGGNFLIDMVMKVAFTTGGAETLDNNKFGSRFFSSISLRSHSHAICTMYPDSILAEMTCMEPAEAMRYSDMIECANAGGAVDRVIYLRPSNAFINNLNQALPTRFLEPLQIVSKISSQSKMALSNALTACTITLICKFRTLQSEQFEAYLNNNYGNSNKLNNQLIYSWYQETPITVGTTDTTCTVPIKCPYDVAETFFYLSEFGSDKILAQTAGAGIKDVSMYFAGKSIFETLPVEALSAQNSRYGFVDFSIGWTTTTDALSQALYARSDRSVAYSTNRSGVYCIPWGEKPTKKNWNFASHSASFGNVNNPELRITLDSALGTSSAKLHVVHRYWLFSSMNPADGTLSVLSAL